jgi:hypothetical protein
MIKCILKLKRKMLTTWHETKKERRKKVTRYAMSMNKSNLQTTFMCVSAL